ncbi:MAG TPA: methionyl-tRNA formyltransferase [Phycisphaerae bacterium]|nr:methionyl-tRNA formyltransferase [Phycisphaerae bacterium]
MKIVFCGSGRFGLPTLARLVGAGHEVVGVLTQPPRPAGRGGKVRPTPVSEAASERHLPATPVADINDPAVVASIEAMDADVMLVADFGQMIKAPARSATRCGAFNLHGSLLPALRGAAPINWAIIRGLQRTGVTVFALLDRMDAGEIFSQRETLIEPAETAEELEARLAALGVQAVDETLAKLAAGADRGTPQDESLVTLAPRLKKSDGRIDFAADAVAIRNLIHGSWPWPGGQARYEPAEGKGLDVTIARAAVAEAAGQAGPPGAVLGDLTIAAGAGRVEIVELKPAGKRRMAWRDFVNGHHVAPGARFVSVRG